MPHNVLKSVFVVTSLMCSSASLHAQEAQENSVSFCESFRRSFCDSAFYPSGVNKAEERSIDRALSRVGFLDRPNFGGLFAQWISSNSHPFTADCSIQSLACRDAQNWPYYKTFVSDVLGISGSYVGGDTQRPFWGMSFDRVVSNVASNVSVDSFDSFKGLCRQAVEEMKVDHEGTGLQNPVIKAEDISWFIRGMSMVPVKSLPRAFEVAKKLTPPSASGYARGLVLAGLSDIKPDDSNIITYLEPYRDLNTSPSLQESVVRVFVRTPEESRNQLREAVNSLSNLALEERNKLKISYRWGDQEEKLIFQAWAAQSLAIGALYPDTVFDPNTINGLLDHLSTKLQSPHAGNFVYSNMYKESRAWYESHHPQKTAERVTTCC